MLISVPWRSFFNYCLIFWQQVSNLLTRSGLSKDGCWSFELIFVEHLTLPSPSTQSLETLPLLHITMLRRCSTGCIGFLQEHLHWSTTFQGFLKVTVLSLFQQVSTWCCDTWHGLLEFSHNTHILQLWQFCPNSNGNKSEIVNSWNDFNANWHLSWCFQFILKWLNSISILIFKYKQYKNANIANFEYYGKTLFKVV